MKTMKIENVRPLLPYRHANFPAETALETCRDYTATLATHLSEPGVFVECPNGAPEMLLRAGEFLVNGYLVHPDKKTAMAWLSANPLGCALWFERGQIMSALYWNGRRKTLPLLKKVGWTKTR
jgi:hypothetical protein